MTYSRRSKASRATGAYANIGLETEVLSASPERLISLLYRGALTAMTKAEIYFEQGNIQERGLAISKAIDIVDSGLKAGINADKGGEIAKNLLLNYEIIIRDLMQANLHNDPQKLATAKQMLKDLSSAWYEAVDPQFESSPPPVTNK